MSRLSTARMLVTLPALFLALGPPIADLNATHVANPLWAGHARLHTMWLISTNSLVMIVALRLLWSGPPVRRTVLLASVLVGAVVLGFFIAAATQSLYGGTLTDPNGIPFRVGPLDANLAGFGFLAVVLTIAVGSAWKAHEAA